MHLLGQFSGRGDTDRTRKAAVRCPAEWPSATTPLLLHSLSLALGRTKGWQQDNQDEQDIIFF